MPPLSGETYKSNTHRMQETTALRLQQRGLFAFIERVQPISALAKLAGKLNLIKEVNSPKAIYQAKDQHGHTHTRAWLQRDLDRPDAVRLLTDVVQLGEGYGEENIVAVTDSEQVQLVVSRDGQMFTDPNNILTPEATVTFIEDSKDTAERVGQAMARAVINGPHFMSP
jgi:hypothetical protein